LFRTIRTAASLLALAGVLHAQGGDFDLDKATPGTLGTSLDLTYVGATPNKLGVLAFSLNGGPTFLSALQPVDTRFLSVGTDLIANWQTVLTGTGSGTYSIALPNDPVFQGVDLHCQVLTARGQNRIIDQISNGVIAQLGQPATTKPLGFTLATARSLMAVVRDRDNDAGEGGIVLAGGGVGSLLSATGLQSSERYGFRDLERSAGPALTAARALAAAIELPDGRTLLAGGLDSAGNALASCEVYDPAIDNFVPTGPMGSARVGHGATLLPDGRVLVAGGTTTLADVTAAITSTLRSAEIYDPGTGSWTSTGNIGGFRLGPALHTLSNGQVMVSGGVQVAFFAGIPLNVASTTACEFFNPTNGTWSNAPAMRAPRAYHQDNQVTLNDGRLLLTGGALVPNLLGAANAAPVADAEYYDPASGIWTAANLGQPRAAHTATLLADGRVLVAGGGQGTLQNPIAVDSTEIFDPTTNAWSNGPALQSPRLGHAAFRTPDDLVVLIGGQGPTGATVTSAETAHF